MVLEDSSRGSFPHDQFFIGGLNDDDKNVNEGEGEVEVELQEIACHHMNSSGTALNEIICKAKASSSMMTLYRY